MQASTSETTSATGTTCVTVVPPNASRQIDQNRIEQHPKLFYMYYKVYFVATSTALTIFICMYRAN
jgi:hypothetical protein